MNRNVPLMFLAAGLPAAEAGVLLAVGLRPALPLAAQVSAPPPFDVLHDVRWLAVYHNSWWTYAVELLLLIAVRGTVDAGIVALAWPSGIARPSFRRLVTTGVLATVVAAVALTPWAAAAVAGSVTSLSWFLIGELLPLLVLVPLLQRGPVLSTWWRGVPPLAALGWSMVAFAVLTADSVAIGLVPAPATVAVAAAAGAVNGWMWRRIVRVGVTGRVRLVRVPVTLVAAVTVVVMMLLFARLTTLVTEAAQGPPGSIGTTGTSTDAIMFVAGYDSTLHTLRAGPGLSIVPFSYRGTDPDGHPLPYPWTATHQSLTASAALLARQVAGLHDRTGRPVALVAESEGTLVVRAYLDTLPHPAVDAVVLMSPLIQPGLVYYPPPTAGSGWGIATGWQLRALVGAISAISGVQVSADEPFVRSLLDQAPLYRDHMLCPVPGVRMIAFLPFADAVLAPPATPIAIPAIEEPGLHALLLTRPSVQQRIVRFLHGDPVDSAVSVQFRLIQLAAGAWQTPPLAARLNSAWQRPAGQQFGGPAPGGPVQCGRRDIARGGETREQ
jgi:hypothetical protein